MKYLYSLLLLFTISKAFCQDTEYKTYSNGLIYSDTAMSKLKHVADSLNSKYKSCNVNPEFYTKKQTIAYYIIMDSGNVSQAKKDMEQQIPFNEFIKRYPEAKVEKNVLVFKQKNKNEKGKEVVDFQPFTIARGSSGPAFEDTNLKHYDGGTENLWLTSYYSYTPARGKKKEYLRALFLPNKFTMSKLPQEYAHMIGYADCLIDTSTTKMNKEMKDGWVDLPANWNTHSKSDKEKLLEKLRSTRVIGGCSMDGRPREHAMNIALLSAETYNWPIFLQSHLDIMNDRFERVSDGSYAWGKRETYIKELEELNINIEDLILGISFRVEDPIENHYYGSVGRLGRALAESQHKEDFEKQTLKIISDKRLDDFNRIIFSFLFKNYNYYLKDKAKKVENKVKLTAAIKTLPQIFHADLLKNDGDE